MVTIVSQVDMGWLDSKAHLLVLGFVVGYAGSLQMALYAGLLLWGVVHTAFAVLARPFSRSVLESLLVAFRLQLNVVSTVLRFAARGFKPLYPEWTLPFEVVVVLTRFALDTYGRVVALENYGMMRAPFVAIGKLMLSSNCKENGTYPEAFTTDDGLEHTWLRDVGFRGARSGPNQQRIVVIHYHGGGYTISDPLGELELGNLTHKLIQKELHDTHGLEHVAVDVLLANYRKSPEHKYPAAANDCFRMYEHVLASEGLASDHIVLSGDSVGAEMALSLCMRLRDAGQSASLPLACLLYSTDFDMMERGLDDKFPHCILTDNFADVVLDQYLSSLGDDEEARRRVTPINRDLTGLPPLFVQVGALERFFNQGIRFVERAAEQGVTNVKLDVLKNMPHDVVMLPVALLPAIEEYVRHACTFAAEHAAVLFRIPDAM
jgi:acetyl esterase/lipase